MTGKRGNLTRWLLLCLLLPGLAGAEQSDAPAPDAGQPARHISGPDQRDRALVRQNPDKVRWLKAGDGRFAVMETESARTEAQGTVLLVADAGQSPAQGLAGELHRVLPALGWHVMSLALPPLPLPARGESIGARAPESENVPEPAADESMAEETSESAITIDLATPEPSADDVQRFEVQARDRIAAALASLQDRPPGIRLLVGIGLGAAPLTRYLSEGSAPGGRTALVWLMPRFQSNGSSADAELPLAWLDGARPWPILDITNSADRQHEASARRVALQGLNGDAAYRQDALVLAPDGAGAGDLLGHRLHSWVARQFE